MSRIIDPFDELAAMFLTGHEHSGQPNGADPALAPLVIADPDAAPQPLVTDRAGTIELLLVGHLPVRAGLWLTPYADALARQVGSVGLIRLEGADCSVQVLRGPEPARSWANPQSIEHAIRDLGGLVNAWVIRPHSDSTAEEWISAGITRATILSSADDAAVVAAYQAMKILVDAARNQQQPPPQIGLAVVGAEPRQAAVVVDRINRTASTHLNIQAPLAMCLPRMDAGIRSTAYVSFPGRGNQPIADVLGWIRAAEEAAIAAAPPPLQFPRPPRSPIAPSTTAPVASAPAPAGASPTAPAFTPAMPRAPISAASGPSAEPPIPAATPAPSTAAPPAARPVAPQHASPSAPPPVESSPHADIKMPPRAVANVEAKTPCASSQPHTHGKAKGLAEFVRGLRPLPFRPPEHERVELAADDDGALHVLAWEAQMRDLEVVEAWARKHRELIGLACPTMGLDFTRPVQSHVFTDEPASLADLHGTAHRLHVLARVEVEGRIGWYAAPLNRPS